ncbi:MAG TPA: hypothetical protein VF323_04200, partial [Candidatus Limnocylindrales bacterium]
MPIDWPIVQKHRGDSAPEMRPLAFGRRDIPAGVIVWGAVLLLAAWIVVTGSLRTVGGIPGPIAWFGLVAVLAMSTALGARSA